MMRPTFSESLMAAQPRSSSAEPVVAKERNSQCIAYVTDAEYAFPTIMSAVQARFHSAASTDICICTSEGIPAFSELEDILSKKEIRLLDTSELLSSKLAPLDPGHFMGRISVSTMAKLVLPEILPPNYTQIIYLDGDTQVVNSLEKLERIDAAPGKFYAALDYIALFNLLEHGKRSSYFNAGVLKFNRENWIGEEAFNLFLTNPELCDGKHDQGALNYVAGDALILISNKWNFPKQFLHLADMQSLGIVHYMAHPKPWHGTFFPWSATESRVYQDLRRESPVFNALYRGIGIERQLVYKFRSIRERIRSALPGRYQRPILQDALWGNYPV
ncbi:glycosyltransferase family 8 protein [Rhizobium rosettiformans]|uniref:glycosyltransferase family 8 protein n=1 Tax=Rhizobium rosettiformans TaxID=1368430 RepID=UPI00285FD081|nr:glycosyltransferase [Rhizobium rosettiformans]MDR7030625.1 lipopolysaccharide biosynthesis glycosyltransferase [Rhizobium rosettiformans]MDR7066510.1 lipopolysaccharide biosynthesis glycosyltransferase [Rhizobium rosettiformans]